MIWSCLDDVHVTSFFLCPVSKRHQIDANVFLRKKTLRKGTRHPNSGMGHSQIGKLKGNVALYMLSRKTEAEKIAELSTISKSRSFVI